MKRAVGRGPRRLLQHTHKCNGDSHGWFTHACELPMEQPAPGLWFLYTCTHCGLQTWRNSKGEAINV